MLSFELIASASPIPVMNIAQLVERADLVVIGEVVLVVEKSAQDIEINGKTTKVHTMVGEIHVDRILKGFMNTPSLTVEFQLPDEPVGYRGLAHGSYRMVFVTKTPSGYVFVSPYYPSTTAIPGVPLREGSPPENVSYELGAVLRSANATADQKQEALYALQALRVSAATAILEHGLEDKSLVLRLIAAAALLERNDLAGLQTAEAALTNRPSGVPNHLFHNIDYAIAEGVRDERAVSLLDRLLRLPDEETRRAAASALRHIGSQSAAPSLVRALNDQDFEIRYYAVVGLAEITGQLDWHPNEEIFHTEESKYLQHWREWGRVNYP